MKIPPYPPLTKGGWGDFHIKLMEQMPNYQTVDISDFKARVILCERVTAFACTRLSAAGIVAITLTLQQGSKTVSLRTTAKARWVN